MGAYKRRGKTELSRYRYNYEATFNGWRASISKEGTTVLGGILMKKWSLLVVPCLFLFIVGCSGNESTNPEKWDRSNGYVIAKEDQKILIVRHIPETGNISVSELLEQNKPDAIWITLKNPEVYDTIAIGDNVELSIEGAIKKSYPAQANATVKVKK
ncbi:MAG TPA: DUF3221 domain-containing protein [Paenibacillus sp.]|nr:hypothetical protein CA599_23830 [Paenibacillus taichungensis]HBU83812.1 DUF3221 domain-containing protein [Paenibacillus sp.]